MDVLSKFLIEPLKYEFIQRALIASLIIGASCGLIGTYIMLRRMSLLGDALAHAVLPGVVISFLIAGKGQIALFIGAVLSGIVTVLLIGFINRNSKIKEDTSIGVVFTGAFALGILIVSQLKQVHIDLSSYLFGDVLGVSTDDIILSAIVFVVILASVILFYKQLLITSFDPTMALTIGISTSVVHYLLMSLLSMTIVSSLQSVGVILVVAMLITPSATAFLLTDKLKNLLILSSCFGVLSSVIGLYLSYHFNYSSGASMVLVGVVIFMLALIFSPSQGILSKYIKRLRTSRLNLTEDTLKYLYKNQTAFDKHSVASMIESEFGISKGKAMNAINNVLKSEFAEIKDGKLYLTEEGEIKALKIIKSHRLWETYITKENITEEKDIHIDAEKYEHILTDDLVDDLDEELGYPEKDPHGSAIPKIKK